MSLSDRWSGTGRETDFGARGQGHETRGPQVRMPQVSPTDHENPIEARDVLQRVSSYLVSCGIRLWRYDVQGPR